MTPSPTRARRRFEPSLVVSVLAVVIAMSGTAYAVGKGEIKSRHLSAGAVTTSKIAPNAVIGAKVKRHSLRLADLGGHETGRTSTVETAINVPADECRAENLTLYNPAPPRVVGSLVVGYLTDANGEAVLNNAGFVMPTVVSETSQGGAIPHLQVCARGGAITVPVGSVFHWRLIGP